MKANTTRVTRIANAPSPHNTLIMHFNVIVTFQRSIRTMNALDAMKEQQLVFGDSQIIFDSEITIHPTWSYDSVMRRLRKAVINEATELSGLSKSDICKISTCGNWAHWEQITGLCEETEAARSKVADDGKFYF